MSLQELDDVAVRENDIAITVDIVPLVHYQHRYEVHKLNLSLLILINLSTLDFDKLVAHVFSDMQHDLVFEHMLDHLVVIGF